MPSVAVLIPTKDRLAYLKRAVQSVFGQKVPADEIIIINDGSKDSTKEYLEALKASHKNLRIIQNEKNRGVNASRNIGMRESVSEWIAWLDDDDEFEPLAVEKVKERLKEMPLDYSVAYFNSKIHRDNEIFIGGFQFNDISNKNFYDPSYGETMTKFNLKGDCKPVFRKKLLEGGEYDFPESVNGFESYTMNLIARDKKGIRYWRDITTIIHQESHLKDRLSINAPRKNPLPLLRLHLQQIPQHFSFYISHPIFFSKKIITMFKLLLNFIDV